MIVYQYDKEGYYIGITEDYGGALPHNCTKLQPPEAGEKHKLKFDGSKWLSEAIPVPQAEEGKEVVWNSEKGEYEQINLTPTFEQTKQTTINTLKQTRDDLEVEPISYNGHLFDFDAKARDRMRYAKEALELSGTEGQLWMTADNQQAVMTVTDFNAITLLAAQRSGTLHIKYNQAKELVEAAQSVDQLEQITEKAYGES